MEVVVVSKETLVVEPEEVSKVEDVEEVQKEVVAKKVVVGLEGVVVTEVGVEDVVEVVEGWEEVVVEVVLGMAEEKEVVD